MQRYEYKVVPAPKRGEKARGAKTTQDRFALTLTGLMNDLGREGWEYLRADTLPCEERVGLTGKQTLFQNMLVFRRSLPDAQAEPAPSAAAIVAPRAAQMRAPLVLSPAAPQSAATAPALGPADAPVAPTAAARNPDLAAE